MKSGGVALLAGGVLAAGALASTLYLDRYDAPGPQPEGITSDGVHLWVADFLSGLIYRVDPATGAVLQSYPAPNTDPGTPARPEGLTWDGTHLWSADWDDRKIYRLLVTGTGLEVTRTLVPPDSLGTDPRPVGLTWDGTALWLTTWSPYWLWRLDAETGEPLRGMDLREPNALYPVQFPRPEDLAWDGADLWITDWGTQKIYRVDPELLTVTRTIPSPGPASVGLTFHGGHLWNGDTGGSGLLPSIYRLEETGGPVPVRPTTWGGLKQRLRGGP